MTEVKNIYLRNKITVRLNYSSVPSRYAYLIGLIPDSWQFNDLCCIYFDIKHIYVSRGKCIDY